MNLALRDIRHNFARFILTTIGISLLLMIVMGMGGIYRGLVEESTLLADRINADLWVVQKNTRGPFAEISRIPRSVEDRVRAVPGVARAFGFVSHTIQRELNGKPLRLTLQGLSWPGDRGEWLPLCAGRPLANSHFEIIVDKSSKLNLGDKIPLGKDCYTVVGLTQRMASVAGDPLAFLSLSDALAVQFDLSPDAIRNEREARSRRFAPTDLGRTKPALSEHLADPAASIPAIASPMISAVVVHVEPGCDPALVAASIAAWPDLTVHTQLEQRGLLLKAIERNHKQLGLFRVLLIIVSAIIMALILYTLTMEKIHDIAMLKLMGARNRVILAMILQQALLLGLLGFVLARFLGEWVFPHFPRRVVIVNGDLLQLAVIVAAISILASLAGVIKAIRIDPGEVLA